MSNQIITAPIIIRVKCPVCEEKTEITISPEDFENALSGIVRIPIRHEYPIPHMIIVDIDQYGFVRGAYIYRKIIRPTTIPIGEVIDILGTERTTYLLYYFLRYEDIIGIHGRDELVKNARLLAQLVGEANKVQVAGTKNIINIDKIRRPKAAIQPLRQIIVQSARLQTDDAKAEWIRGEYNRIKNGLKELEKVFDMRKSWTLDSLLRAIKANINKDELRLLVDILEDRGYKASRRIRNAEYKIKSFFG